MLKILNMFLYLFRVGRMIFVLNASAGVAEEYSGEWKDGMMHGQGEMRYIFAMYRVSQSLSFPFPISRNK
jgi:hypothetical protein